MLGKKENYFAPSCAVVVVNLGAQDIVGHSIAELIDRSLSRDSGAIFLPRSKEEKCPDGAAFHYNTVIELE